MLSTSVKLVRPLRPLLPVAPEPPGPPCAPGITGRWISRMLGAVAVILRVGWSGGTKTPSCRKDLTFVIRISDDADGDSRIIGFECRPGLLGTRPADGVGLTGLACGLRRRMLSAVLRTCEKSFLFPTPPSQLSFIHALGIYPVRVLDKRTYCRLNPS